jgi:uncharacterized protein
LHVAVFEYDDSLEAFLDAGVYDFEWDSGNRSKNWKRHKVTTRECEEIFFSGALPIGAQVDPAANEPRYGVIGETSVGRLFVVFTLRQRRIRVVSARPMTRQEEEDYDLLREK